IDSYILWRKRSHVLGLALKVKGRDGVNVPNGLQIILPSQIRRPSGCHDLYLGDDESRRHSCEYVQESNPGTRLHP
ncbi:MAG: hypothetical protein AB7V04_14535, partial [Desulfomonilaceae bacterium]